MFTCMKQHRAKEKCHSNCFGLRLLLILYFFLQYTIPVLYFMLSIISFRELNNPFIGWNRILTPLIFLLVFLPDSRVLYHSDFVL